MIYDTSAGNTGQEHVSLPPLVWAVSETTHHSIFLIHGFLRVKHGYYRGILEHWVSKLAEKSNNPVTARVFRFDAASVARHGKDALQRQVWHLRRFLLQHLHQNGAVAEEPPLHAPLQTVAKSHRPANRTILSIVHGLSSWIVKDVLAHPTSDSILLGYQTTIVKFLDLDVHDYRHLDDAYERYLERNWSTFHFGPPKRPSGLLDVGELTSYLREIDQNFDVLARAFDDDPKNPRASRAIFKAKDLQIWMSRDKSADSRQVRTHYQHHCPRRITDSC